MPRYSPDLLFSRGIPAKCSIQDKKPPKGGFRLSSCIIPPGGYNGLHMKYMDEKNKANVVRRLKLLEGQVRGLQKMVENDTYCIDVITQTSAVKQGLSNVEDLLLENHLGHCVHHQMKSGQVNKAKNEIIKVYKLKRK